MRRSLKIALIAVLSILVLLLVLPMVFEGKIKDIIRKKINENLNAEFNFTDAKISLFDHFPQATVNIYDLSIVNKEPFAGDTLASVKKASLSMSLTELMKSENEAFNVNSFIIDEARLNVRVNKDGAANYDIAKNTGDKEPVSDTANEDSAFKLSLQEYAIRNSSISYTDEGSDMVFQLDNLNHSGNGDLSAMDAQLNTGTDALVTVMMDSVTYLKSNPVKLDAILGVDLQNNKYTFLQNEATINQLKLMFDGFVQLKEEGTLVDISFKTPSSDFRNFLALIPEVYSKNIENVEVNGNFDISGYAKGLLDDTHIPKFDVRFASKDASFKYPDLPRKVENINIDGVIANTAGLAEDTFLNIGTFSFAIDRDVFSGKIKAEKLGGNPLVDAVLRGKLDLSHLAEAYPLSLDTPLKGILEADIKSSFDMKSVEEQQYEKTRNEGALSLKGFEFVSPELKNPLLISSAALTFNTQNVVLNEFNAQIGQTDFRAAGTIKNFLGFMFNKENITGDFDLNSGVFAIDDFMMAEIETGSGEGQPATETEQLKIPSFLDVTIKAAADKVIYDNLSLKNLRGKLTIRDEKVELSDMTADLLGGSIILNGQVSTAGVKPVFNMQLGIASFDLSSSFKELELLQSLAPVAGALQGKMNSTLSLSGGLNNDMTPDLLTVSGSAVAELLSAGLNPENSKALSLLDNQLSFVDLKEVDISKLKTSVSFDNGKVQVKPFQLKYKDIAIDVSGSHDFNMGVDYKLSFNVPAKYLGSSMQSALTKLGEKDLNNMTIPVTASVTGTYSNPAVSTDMEKAVSDLTGRLLDSQKEKLKQEGETKVKEVISGLLNDKKKDTIGSDSMSVKKTEEVKETAEKLLKNIFGKKKKDTVN